MVNTTPINAKNPDLEGANLAVLVQSTNIISTVVQITSIQKAFQI